MFKRLAQFITNYWLWVIVAWLALVVGLRIVAPRWDDVTHDGDLAFLPTDVPSVRGEALTKLAFPNTRFKSQIVLVVARGDRRLDPADLKWGDRLSSRFHNRLGATEWERGNALTGEAQRLESTGHATEAAEFHKLADAAWKNAIRAFEEANLLDESFAAPLHNAAIVRERVGMQSEATRDRDMAWQLQPDLKQSPQQMVPPGAADLPLVDVWNRHHEVFGTKLRSNDKQAQLVMLQLANEFMATDNIRVLGVVEQEMAQFVRENSTDAPVGLQTGISGSAAVGGDMLRAAQQSIRHTELLTILLVMGILLVVYRSPLLVVVPLATIAVSLSVSIGLLALLTQLQLLPGFEWWGFKVFKTTRIFIVVIMFGSGTDFCLFLISRLKEEFAQNRDVRSAVQSALTKVGGALVGSALTTVLGLAMMFFADFAKFRNSGPAIGLCLLVTLLACLTFTPALLCAFGRNVFWPSRIEMESARPTRMDSYWRQIMNRVVRSPGWILYACLLAMTPMAFVGWSVPDRVTFDLVSELPADSSSTKGNELLKRHFPVGEGGPIIVLAHLVGAGFDNPDKEVANRTMAGVIDLTRRLNQVPGVHSVRSIAEPLGDPPGPASIQKRILRRHPLSEAIFLAQVPPYRGEIARFELILDPNPFSMAAIEVLGRAEEMLRAESQRTDSFWNHSQFYFAGTTAGIRDLRTVTRSDLWRIQLLVPAVVFVVVLCLLRRPMISVYLIVSVVFSYLVTIGATELYFRWLYGDTFLGLDWKVPIFLFVILVAVGEDYNIYLVTRILEEQRRLGPFAGLREGTARTGGIISSCGVIMAGSFISMYAGSLRGIAELGFALTLGIVLDTFIVRTILVPAFLAIALRLTTPAAWRHMVPYAARHPLEAVLKYTLAVIIWIGAFFAARSVTGSAFRHGGMLIGFAAAVAIVLFIVVLSSIRTLARRS